MFEDISQQKTCFCYLRMNRDIYLQIFWVWALMDIGKPIAHNSGGRQLLPLASTAHFTYLDGTYCIVY